MERLCFLKDTNIFLLIQPTRPKTQIKHKLELAFLTKYIATMNLFFIAYTSNSLQFN